MNIKELVHEIWKDERCKELGLNKTQIETMLEVFGDVIKECLLQNDKIKIKGLFSICLKPMKGRRIKDLVNGGTMYLNDYYKVVVTPSKVLKDAMRLLKKSEVKH